MVGATYAWFSSGAVTENIFTAGTLDLEVINLDETSFSGDWAPGECFENQYTITNTGSKKMYVRASFDGFWKRIYHRNTATVTASYNGQTVTDSNQAHYMFGDYSPPYNSNFNQEATQGFFDDNIPERTQFPIVWGSSETNNSNGPNETNSNSNFLTGYPDPCTGPLVEPVTGKKLDEEYPGQLFDNPNALNDPDPDKVQQILGPSVENCGQLNSFKINLDEDDLSESNNPYTIDDDVVESSDPNSQFEVNIYKSEGNEKFAFSSLYHPVYHVYAKGGNQGGNFYSYYPAFDKGVYQDCGLSQPGGGWSHITFYYCEPPAQPSIEIEKQVSIDGGDSWEPADEEYGPELIGNQPKFRFWVTNTGNVTLTNIVIEDTVFGHIGTIASLPAGYSDGFIIDDPFWDTILDTGNVEIELCENDHNGYIKNDWAEIGDYFYYLHPIDSGQSVTLCIKVCLTGAADAKYDGAQFYLYSYFEAVQTTNELVDDNWPNNPYE